MAIKAKSFVSMSKSVGGNLINNALTLTKTDNLIRTLTEPKNNRGISLP